MKWKGGRESKNVQQASSAIPDESTIRELAKTDKVIAESDRLIDKYRKPTALSRAAGAEVARKNMDEAVRKFQWGNRTRDPHRSPEYWKEYREGDDTMMGEPTRTDHVNKSYVKR